MKCALRNGSQSWLVLVLWASLCLPLPAQTNGSDGCLTASGRQAKHDVIQLWHGMQSAPGNATKTDNLKWELPILAASTVLIAWGDTPASQQIQSTSLQHSADQWSNIGMGMELGAAGLLYGLGCGLHADQARKTGLTALEAMGAASVFDAVIKRGTNRQRPYVANSAGQFWEGGQSFPSGHAAASFAFAGVVMHSYPHSRWVKWSALGLATGVSLLRFPAKQHFLSDIVVGGTLGYVTGWRLASTPAGSP
jgi:hypothetical protein